MLSLSKLPPVLLKSSPRWGDFPAAILLMVMAFTAAARLEETRWATNLSVVPFLGIAGVIAGLALGQSRFSKKLAAFFAVFYGVFLTAWQLGSVIEGNLPWFTRLDLINSRLGIIILQIIDRAPVRDSLLFVTIMAILFWSLSLHAGYMLTRHGSGWWAVLPLGLTLFVIHAFDSSISRRALYLAVFLFFSLLLIAREVYLYHKQSWIKSRSALPPHLGLDFIRFALLATTILVGLAWAIPGLGSSVPIVVEATRPLRLTWNSLKDRWGNAFASLRSSAGFYTEFYGSSLALGRGAEHTDTVMFYVSEPGAPPTGGRFYWRAAVYDSYLNGVWTDTIFEFEDFDPASEPIMPSLGAGRVELTVEIIPMNYINTLYTPSQPFWVSRPASIKAIQNPDGTLDISGFRSNPALRPREAYQVQASLSAPTITQLREAGIEYPAWVTERYLALPVNITPRTRQLAEEITAGLESPYDKAAAITSYLRENIEYQETIPAIPEGKEPIDWFLFDFKKGFCNYYASAEVVLLRSLGIPARWAVGYAQGERLEDGSYLVRNQQAHSWPEVYFPTVGWVEFEPTVSQPVIVRLPGELQSEDASQPDDEALQGLRNLELDALDQQRQDLAIQNTPPERPVWFTGVILGVSGIILVGASLFIYRNRNKIVLPSFPVMIETYIIRLGFQPPHAIKSWARQAALPPLSKSYQEINRALSRLKNPPQPHLTPAERAALLKVILPSSGEAGVTLLAEYQTAVFSNQTPNLPVARAAGAEIRKQSIKAYIQRFFVIKRKSHKRPLPPLARGSLNTKAPK